jgi:muramoyltetrapeptide carboxypeptidase LdcA involved in peptidoglycan recycling
MAMTPTVPRKLRSGDTIRVVSPSSTAAAMLDDPHVAQRDARFAELGPVESEVRWSCGSGG